MFPLIHCSQYRCPQLVWNGAHKTFLQKVHLNSSCNGWTKSMPLPFIPAISIMKDTIKMSLFSSNIYDFNFESIMINVYRFVPYEPRLNIHVKMDCFVDCHSLLCGPLYRVCQTLDKPIIYRHISYRHFHKDKPIIYIDIFHIDIL